MLVVVLLANSRNASSMAAGVCKLIARAVEADEVMLCLKNTVIPNPTKE